MQVEINPIMVAYSLRTFGEDAVADRVDAMGEDDVRLIGEVSVRLVQGDPKMPWPKVISLAAVEVVEGVPRELKRGRRVLDGLPKPPPGWTIRIRGQSG